MLDFIIGNNIVKIVAIIAIAFVLISLIALMGEYEAVRWLVGTPVFLALIVSAFYCYGHINSYYSAQGGIYGALIDLIQTNKTDTQVKDQELTHKFTNFNLTKDEKGYYSVKQNDTTIFEVDKNEFYMCYVNGYPTEVVNQVIGDDDSKFIFKFSYIFFDYDDNANLVPIADDTIQIEYLFLKTNTEILIKTSCNEEVYGLWNSFFNKNNFEITFKKASEEIASKQELVTLTVLVNDEVYSTIKLKQGSSFILPSKIEKDGYIFNGFMLNGEKVDILRNIQEDMTITADMTFDMSIKEVEYFLFKKFGIATGFIEDFIELEELKFYKQFWHGLTKENKEYSVTEYRQNIANLSLFKFEYDENCSFEEYLQKLYECIVKS